MLIGRHPTMLDLERTIDGISRLDSNVIILGESGTGKELVARAIHDRGPRARAPFVGINCGAFTRSLLEDQLFGHSRGAFTGAEADQDGLFVAAGKGTLFLDEIAEIDIDLQGRLLRAIQEREVVPLGTHRPVPWQARLITATNQDIERLTAEGRFRRDLSYRIHVVEVRTPPLRERMEDIPALAAHFLDRLAEGRGARKKVSPEALDLLLKHSYPGNVRELRNVIERAHAMGEGEVILPRDLPPELRERSAEPSFKPLSQIEREHILRALVLAGGKKSVAAKLLEIDRNRLNRKLKKYGITALDPDEAGGSLS
jgi:two-component system, NtrC family, response regulator HydG